MALEIKGMNRNFTNLLIVPLFLFAYELASPQDLNEALIDRYIESHRVEELRAPDQSTTRFSGKWEYFNGGRSCDGYLVSRPGEDYCEAKIPDDWEPFIFDGRTYYRQPLSGAGR